MKATDLRVGNLVNYDNKQITITVSDFAVFDLYEKKGLKEKHYNPISLTEEWLLKFGFSEDKGCFDKVFYISDDIVTFRVMISDDGWWFIIDKSIGDGTRKGFNLGNYQHVHQLQNLFYALTGNELTIK